MIVKLLAERGSVAVDLVVRSSLFTRSPNLWALVDRRVTAECHEPAGDAVAPTEPVLQRVLSSPAGQLSVTTS